MTSEDAFETPNVHLEQNVASRRNYFEENNV